MQTLISPVAVFPGTANVLYIRSLQLGPPPGYYYELQDVQTVEGVVTVLKNGNVAMTQEQWAAWPADADDDEYQLNAISANLGLVRA